MYGLVALKTKIILTRDSAVQRTQSEEPTSKDQDKKATSL